MVARVGIMLVGLVLTIILGYYFGIMPGISAYKVAIFTGVPFGTGLIIGFMR